MPSSEPGLRTYTAFISDQRIATGSIYEVALAVRAQVDADPDRVVVFFDDELGEVVEVSLRGTPAQLTRRLHERFGKPVAPGQGPDPVAPPSPGRGRPKLGVVAHEVTLLPSQWAWLQSQPGSVSMTLRKLVDEARRTHAARDARRQAQTTTYRFITAMAGDRPGFEDAIRALFAGEQRRFFQLIEAWPIDIVRHAERLAAGAFADKPLPSP